MKERYNEEEVKQKAIEYFKGDELTATVWTTKYALKNFNKFVELSPENTIERIAKEIERIELKYNNPISYNEIYDTIKNFNNFIFGGSILFGVGNNYQVTSLGNCFFIHNGYDSYGSIMQIDEQMVQLMKRRGGVGITIENLRPCGSFVNNSAQTSTGAVSFADRYSNSTREVAQDGRRGALMITMSVHHIDIQDFILKKDDLTKVTGANISVKITDEFMKAVEMHDDFILNWPTTNKQPILKESIPYNNLIKLEDGSYVKKVKAKDLWDLIIKQAHKNAEPGILFWDTIIRESPADCYANEGFITLGTNPCSEIPLSPFDSCRLGSVNLYAMVDDPFTEKASFNYQRFIKTVHLSQRFMDDVITLEEEKINKIIEKIEKDKEPIEFRRVEYEMWIKIKEVLLNGRRTGLGVLGEADMLAALGYKYGTKEATTYVENIMKILAVESYKESIILAKERGCFPIWNLNKESSNPFIIRIISQLNDKEYQTYCKYGRRNIANLAIAPTGSLSMLAQTTSGIEPIFSVAHKRRRKINPSESLNKAVFQDQQGDWWEEYSVVHPKFKVWADMKGIDIINVSKEQLQEIVDSSPWAGSESHDIDYLEKIKMVGDIQKWIDHSISVTTNLPKSVTLDEVNKIYFEAWKSGCKGATIYRDGSRMGVLVNNNETKNEEFVQHNAPKRPKVLNADYYIANAKGRKFAVIVGLLDNKPYETFAFENPSINSQCKGKIIRIRKGYYDFVSDDNKYIENIHLAAELIEERSHTIFISMLLRHGAPVEYIIEVTKKVDENISSFSSAVRRILSKYIEDKVLNETCPDCGGKLIRSEGCVHCEDCPYSLCS
jgi:ribonucleoside-diphosphate reductase alpha chain